MVNRLPILGRRLLLATALGIAGGLLCFVFAGHEDTDTTDRIPVLITNGYIPPSAPIKPSDVKVVLVPKSYVPPGTFYSVRELANDREQLLYSAAIAIPQGQPLTRSLLLESAKSQGVTHLLSPGHVALSVGLDAVHGVGSWLQPGDVIALYQGAPNHRLLFSNLAVLAVNKHRLGMTDPIKNEERSLLEDPTQDSGSVVTLRVNPVQAGVIIQARDQGTLTAVLRAPGDGDL